LGGRGKPAASVCCKTKAGWVGKEKRLKPFSKWLGFIRTHNQNQGLFFSLRLGALAVNFPISVIGIYLRFVFWNLEFSSSSFQHIFSHKNSNGNKQIGTVSAARRVNHKISQNHFAFFTLIP